MEEDNTKPIETDFENIEDDQGEEDEYDDQEEEEDYEDDLEEDEEEDEIIAPASPGAIKDFFMAPPAQVVGPPATVQAPPAQAHAAPAQVVAPPTLVLQTAPTTLQKAPPIPASMTQPAPATLIIQKPAPDVVIQPGDLTRVEATIAGTLPPPTGGGPTAAPTVVATKPVAVKPVIKPPATLEAMLVKTAAENEDYYNLRSSYSRAAVIAFSGKINPATAVLIGRMAANKVLYGLTYPEDSDRVIRYINSSIQANPAAYTQ